MKYITTSLATLLIVLLTISCSNSEQKNEKPYLNFKINKIDKKYGACDGDGICGEIKIEYPLFKNNKKEVDSKLNAIITKSISSFYDVKTIKRTSELFIKEFSEFVKEFPDATNNKWNTFMIYQVNSNTENLLSLTFNMEGYTGGAHGFRTKTSSNYNPNTGEIIKLDDIVTDVKKLKIIGRDFFIKENNLDSSKSLNEQGFWFIEGEFVLNNNFIISKDGLSFHYNQYEIAPYSMGTFNVTIPLKSIKNILKDKSIFK